jgi:hypothetical protein
MTCDLCHHPIREHTERVDYRGVIRVKFYHLTVVCDGTRIICHECADKIFIATIRTLIQGLLHE